MSVIIMRGIPGSGKTTWAEQEIRRDERNPSIISADDYFMTELGYDFDPTMIGEAHKDCFRRFLAAVSIPQDKLIIVDNTNTRLWECAPYVLAAETCNHKVKLVSLRAGSLGDAAVMAKRNAHGVPFRRVLEMHERFEPGLPHWDERTVIVSAGIDYEDLHRGNHT